jgi:hypothetical protein
MYSVLGEDMARIFYVDNSGNFRISASQLSYTQSPYKNGTYHVPVRLTDLHGNQDTVSVIVQTSLALSQAQCPKIAENVDCKYTVNRTVFAPSLYFYCSFFFP